jgi:hypothetical protein
MSDENFVSFSCDNNQKYTIMTDDAGNIVNSNNCRGVLGEEMVGG